MSNQKWRFIDSGNNHGYENMAIDEALLLSFNPDSSLPILRFYGWSPEALSLGRFQKAADVLDLECCHAAGVSVVRRITGGGAIFHSDEITYSIVCAPHQIPDVSSIKDSFRILTGFLLQFYHNLGLEASYAVDKKADREKLGERTDYCFAGKETFDILINGHKIGGNAQRRMKRVIFQHGSIPLVNRVSEGAQFLRTRPPNLDGSVTALSDESIAPDVELLKSRLKDAFCNNLNTVLIDEPVTDFEKELSVSLENEKYLHKHWNLHGEGV